MTVTAIVLAGGRSSRFGGDKLAARLGEGSVLAATVTAVAPLADELLIAGPHLPGELAGIEPAPRLVPDAEPFGGPLPALAGALDALVGAGEPSPTGGLRLGAPGPVALVVGGDMPRLVPEVLVAMLEVLDADPTVDAVILGQPPKADPAPPRQVLPMAVRLEAARDAARAAVATGDRSLGSLLDRLAHVALSPDAWLPLDPEEATLTDVDTGGDLARLRTAEDV